MGVKGVAAWVGGIAGGLVLAGVAGFFLMPRACGCGLEPDPERLVGMTGSELAAETEWCDGAGLAVPRGELTWWTLTEEPQIVVDAEVDPLPYRVSAVPYGHTDADPQVFEVVARSGSLTLAMPEGRSATHIAIGEDGTVPFSLVETDWGAALFVDGCADAGLRATADGGTLTDAQVAEWPTFTAADIELLYGPAPAAPAAITLDSLNQVVTPDGQQVSLTFLAYGDMPADDKVWLVTGAGLLHRDPFAGIVGEERLGLGTAVAPGESLGVVLERDGLHYLLGTLTMPDEVVSDSPMATTVKFHYEMPQRLKPLEGGAAEDVPNVEIPPLHFS